MKIASMYLVIWFSFALAFYGIRYPVEPTVPTVNGSAAGSTSAKKRKKKIQFISQRVRATLGSQDTLVGTISAHKSITFRHYKNGLFFTKKIGPAEIKKIRVTRYSYKLIKRTKRGKLYQFEPAEINLVLKNGRSYRLSKIFSFLRKFRIETIDGSTWLYTFFADTYDKKKGWDEVASKSFHYHRTKPHPKAAVEIVFSASAETTSVE